MKLELYLKRLQLLFYVFFATGMILLAIYGGYKNFHSVPFWDSWGGNLNFYIKFLDGNYSELWSLHNEHRIIISKILFIIDNYFFGGLSIFLIVVNYLLIIFAVFLFILMVKNIVKKRDYEKNIIILIIAGFLFSWVQHENITWSFQSLFFLAQSLPLLVLITLAYYFITGKNYLFHLALVFGVMSAGTMANGLIILPLITCYILIKEKNKFKVLTTFIVTGLTIYLYLLNYHGNVGHGKISEAIFNHTFELLQYFLIYLGNPFGKIFTQYNQNYIFEFIFAIIFLTLLTLIILKLLKSEIKNNYLLEAAILYILFILATDFITSGGRVVFGLAQATSSRYTTPAIMAWTTLMIISYFYLLNDAIKSKKYLALLTIIVSYFLISYQFNNIIINTSIKTDKNLISLALTLGVKDEGNFKNVYHNNALLYLYSEKSLDKNLLFFGHYPYKGLRTELNTLFNNIQNIKCDSAIIQINKIPTDTNFLAIKFWIMYSNQYQPEIIRLLDGNNKVVGFAQPEIIDRSFLRTSFNKDPTQINGYIFANTVGKKIKAVGDTSSCFAELLVQ